MLGRNQSSSKLSRCDSKHHGRNCKGAIDHTFPNASPSRQHLDRLALNGLSPPGGEYPPMRGDRSSMDALMDRMSYMDISDSRSRDTLPMYSGNKRDIRRSNRRDGNSRWDYDDYDSNEFRPVPFRAGMDLSRQNLLIRRNRLGGIGGYGGIGGIRGRLGGLGGGYGGVGPPGSPVVPLGDSGLGVRLRSSQSQRAQDGLRDAVRDTLRDNLRNKPNGLQGLGGLGGVNNGFDPLGGGIAGGFGGPNLGPGGPGGFNPLGGGGGGGGFNPRLPNPNNLTGFNNLNPPQPLNPLSPDLQALLSNPSIPPHIRSQLLLTNPDALIQAQDRERFPYGPYPGWQSNYQRPYVEDYTPEELELLQMQMRIASQGQGQGQGQNAGQIGSAQADSGQAQIQQLLAQAQAQAQAQGQAQQAQGNADTGLNAGQIQQNDLIQLSQSQYAGIDQATLQQLQALQQLQQFQQQQAGLNPQGLQDQQALQNLQNQLAAYAYGGAGAGANGGGMGVGYGQESNGDAGGQYLMSGGLGAGLSRGVQARLQE